MSHSRLGRIMMISMRCLETERPRSSLFSATHRGHRLAYGSALWVVPAQKRKSCCKSAVRAWLCDAKVPFTHSFLFPFPFHYSILPSFSIFPWCHCVHAGTESLDSVPNGAHDDDICSYTSLAEVSALRMSGLCLWKLIEGCHSKHLHQFVVLRPGVRHRSQQPDV